MPPHLHPRSTATSTLFAGTLIASFVVVGIPHLFPCPRPRTGYADAEIQFDDEGRPIRRTTKGKISDTALRSSAQGRSCLVSDKSLQQQSQNTRKGLTQSKNLEEEAALFRELQREEEVLEKEARECPVPKPTGLIGRLLGFEERRVAVSVDEKS
jgi:hypothetical protein